MGVNKRRSKSMLMASGVSHELGFRPDAIPILATQLSPKLCEGLFMLDVINVWDQTADGSRS